MTNKQISFADRVVGINLHNGLVRMDLAVHAGRAKDKDDKPVQRLQVTTQVVMPLDAFAVAVAMQDKFLKDLIAGETQRRQTQAGQPDVAEPRSDKT